MRKAKTAAGLLEVLTLEFNYRVNLSVKKEIIKMVTELNRIVSKLKTVNSLYKDMHTETIKYNFKKSSYSVTCAQLMF